jgi:hypothetical protein
MHPFPPQKLTCSAPYNPTIPPQTVTMALACSKGRHGTASIKRDTSDGLSGSGTFSISDGSTGFFSFGIDNNRLGVGKS